MLTENVSTLKIHKLTQEQYDRELAAGNIDESALYLTPDEEIDLTPYATKDDLSKKADTGHTHNYAGSSSAGGSATSAVKLDTATAGSATQPAYFSGGKPVACTYTLGKSVPSDAKFTDTTYSAATQSAQGLMSAADKKKLDGIATGANAYSLPTASSSTLGGVKTTSTVTSTSGYTACPIISGVPYYKDTNTTSYLPLSGGTVTGATTFNSTVKIGNATLTYDSTNKRMVISVA